MIVGNTMKVGVKMVLEMSMVDNNMSEKIIIETQKKITKK